MFFKSAKRPANPRWRPHDECLVAAHPSRRGGLSPEHVSLIRRGPVRGRCRRLTVTNVKRNGLQGSAPMETIWYFASDGRHSAVGANSMIYVFACIASGLPDHLLLSPTTRDGQAELI